MSNRIGIAENDEYLSSDACRNLWQVHSNGPRLQSAAMRELQGMLLHWHRRSHYGQRRCLYDALVEYGWFRNQQPFPDWLTLTPRCDAWT
jgi:hypothetical protein